MKTKTKYALQSTVNDGFLMKHGNEKKVATTSDYDSELIFRSEIKTFDTKADAEKFLNENKYYAMEVVNINDIFASGGTITGKSFIDIMNMGLNEFLNLNL